MIKRRNPALHCHMTVSLSHWVLLQVIERPLRCVQFSGSKSYAARMCEVTIRVSETSSRDWTSNCDYVKVPKSKAIDHSSMLIASEATIADRNEPEKQSLGKLFERDTAASADQRQSMSINRRESSERNMQSPSALIASCSAERALCHHQQNPPWKAGVDGNQTMSRICTSPGRQRLIRLQFADWQSQRPAMIFGARILDFFLCSVINIKRWSGSYQIRSGWNGHS